MMMTGETKWGPQISQPAGGWPEGKCPIPGKEAGDYRVLIDNTWWYTPHGLSDSLNWPYVTAYRVRADLMHRVQPAATDVAEKMAEALRSAQTALQPLHDAAFNDNGDITVTGHYGHEETVAGYFAHKKVTAALAAYAASKEAGR